MNDTRDNSEDFSVERGDRRGRDYDTDKSSGDSAAKPSLADKASPTGADEKTLPDRIRRKYYLVASENGKHGPDKEARLYADERGEYLAFKVTEDRLITRLAAAEVIHDMVTVAEHRQWDSIQVRGSVEFRREAWLEAGARGIEVQGYQPTDLDRQALADRQEVWSRTHPRTHEVKVRSVSDGDARAERLDYDKGVAGRVIEIGRAPYRNHKTAEASTYVAIELENGQRHKVWGVGLENVVAESNARPGDQIHLRREGVERVLKAIKVIDAASGSSRIERRQVPRNRWRVTAEKFRSANPTAAARDPALIAARSHMVIIEKALERALAGDDRVRRNLMEAVRERIAGHLERGRSFSRARLAEPIQDHHRSGSDKVDARQNRTGERVRFHDRER
jgi:hypothetical protein